MPDEARVQAMLSSTSQALGKPKILFYVWVMVNVIDMMRNCLTRATQAAPVGTDCNIRYGVRQVCAYGCAGGATRGVERV